MAGDWIKMTHALPEKPEVLALVAKTGLNRFEVVGRLFVLWRWFDNNTQEGNAASVTLVTLEECLFGYRSDTNFCKSVAEVGWLIENEHGVAIPNFDYHISESAKTRAQTAKRVNKSKNKAKNAGQKSNGDSVTLALLNALPREEKRREENKPSADAPKPKNTTLPSGFCITPELRKWASEKGITRLDERLEHFVGYAKANGKKYTDWYQAFQNACRDDWAKLNGKPAYSVSDIFAGAI